MKDFFLRLLFRAELPLAKLPKFCAKCGRELGSWRVDDQRYHEHTGKLVETTIKANCTGCGHPRECMAMPSDLIRFEIPV